MRRIFIVSILFFSAILPTTTYAASLFDSSVRLVREPSSTKLYAMIGGFRYHIRDLSILQSYEYRNKPTETVTTSEFEKLKQVRLVKSSLGPRVYLLDTVTGQKIWFPTEQSFVGSGERWTDIVQISGKDSLAYPNARALKVKDDPRVYVVDYETLTRRHVVTENDFNQAGLRWNKIVTVEKALLEAFADAGVFNPSLEAEPEKPIDQIPVGALTVSQRLIPASLFASGTSHNVLQRINLTASTRPVTVTGITLRRQGLVSDEDFASVAVVDDEGFLLAEPNRPSRGILTFNFAEPIVVAPQQTRIVTVVAAFQRQLTAGGQLPVGFSLVDSTSIATSGSVSGQFPVVSPSHRIVPASTIIGSLRVSADDTFSLGALVVGEKDTPLNSFIFEEQSGVEDILLHRVIVTLSGSLRAQDFTGFELVDDKNKIIASNPVIRGQQLAFSPATPYLVPRSEQRKLRVRADVVGGADRRGIATIQNAYDVRAVGKANGYAITPEAGGGAFPVGRQGILEVAPGSVTIGVSKESPTGGLPRGGNGLVLATFEVRPGSQELYWRRVEAKIVSSAGALPLTDNLRFRWKGGDTFGSVTAASLHNTKQSVSLQYPKLSGNKTAIVEVVVDVAQSMRIGDSYRVELSNAEFDIVNGGNDIVFGGTVTGSNRTVQEVTLLARYDTRFVPTGIIAGRTRVAVGRFLVKASAGEGVVVKEIVLKPAAASGLQFTDGFSNVTLGGVKIATPTGTAFRFPFNTSITSGTEKTFDLTIDTTTSADGEEVAYRIDAITAVGAKSGVKVDVVLDAVTTPTITFRQSTLQFMADAVTLPTFVDNKAILGAFKVTAGGVEDIDITGITVIENDDSAGISVTRGYTNLRIERASDRRAVTRSVASPVGGSGGDRLTGSSWRVTAGSSATYYVVANISEPTGDTISLRLTTIEARGRTSGLGITVSGSPLALSPVTF